MEMETLSKLDVEDQPFSLYLLTAQNAGAFQLRAFDGKESWTARITQRQLKEMADNVSIEEKKFKEETEKALTRQDLGLLNFVYSAVRVGSRLELTWKKHILSDNIKFLLGSVTFDLVRDEGVSNLLDFAVTRLEESALEISDMKKDNIRLASERLGALSRLEKCANLQQDIERDLFGKFKVVLNEKKAKIRKLMEQLSTTTEELNRVKQSLSKNIVVPPSTASEDVPGDHGDETDDEMVHSPSPIATAVSPGPGKMMESLLGDPKERTISSPPVKRRKRNAGSSKVKGQPVELPRPPLMSRSSSASQSTGKVNNRKTSSDSKKSEDSMESDDLLQLL